MEKEMVLERKRAMDMREAYIAEMKLNELSSSTIAKYVADINQWLSIAPEKISKASILDYKENLCKNYKVASVNSKIISINRYLKWLGIKELTVKTKRIQNPSGLENMITKECYLKMLRYADARNKRKQYCIMKTIAQTGIRIGELKYVTVEAVKEGSTVVWNKGKYRTVYFTDNLRHELLRYCMEIECSAGVIFSGREKGSPITPGAVWKSLKYIARQVDVPEEMVYPHSFRHLFAKEYMRKIGDISELADLLGHSRLETTWIYTKTTSDEKRRKLELLDL
ncbi:MAG: Tyrosine recombinase XerD [Firmicutes bacterium ADurb.Bin419]|nr:MAG: Tyrosine recombinase XerD [Firmicutes bacterium ADurb.Bin419]